MGWAGFHDLEPTVQKGKSTLEGKNSLRTGAGTEMGEVCLKDSGERPGWIKTFTLKNLNAVSYHTGSAYKLRKMLETDFGRL